jgi:four helix bundle protein
MGNYDLKKRTKEFAKSIIDLCRALPDNREGRRIGDQIFRSGTSVGANYRSACRGRSKPDFSNKLGIVLEEADETLYWLEIIDEKDILKGPLVIQLLREANELVSIFVASLNTLKTDKRRP